MPRYQVIEKRAYYYGYLIDAEDERSAKNSHGDIVSTSETDSWGDETHSIEVVADDQDEIELP